jgi:hypothetical protein
MNISLPKETSRRHFGHKLNAVDMRSGSEGSQHDPYEWHEITIHGRNGPVTFRQGSLGYARTTFNDEVVESRGGCGQPAEDFFEQLVGVTPQVLEKAVHRAQERRIRNHLKQCHAYGTMKTGYPGETFLVCEVCNAFLDSSFNPSAIE